MLKIIAISFSILFVGSQGLAAQPDSSYRFSFPESWEEAKKMSKETQKQILLYRTFWISSTSPKVDRNIFRNKAVMDSLSKEYVLYEAPKRVKPRERLYNKYPCVYGNMFVITNHNEDIIYQFIATHEKEKLFQELRESKNIKSIQSYYEVLEYNKSDSTFMHQFVDALLDQYVNDKEVFNYYLDHFFGINDNCKRILCRELVDERSSRIFMKHYFEFQNAGFRKRELERRLINSVIYDFKKTHGHEIYEKDRQKGNELLLEMTRSFLGESEAFKAPYISSFNLLNSLSDFEDNPTEENKKKYIEASLSSYDHDILDIYGEYQFFKNTYDLSLLIDRQNDMQRLIQLLETKPTFQNQFEYLEILAICYYRMNDEQTAAKLLAKANELAVTEKVKFRPVLPQLKKEGKILKL